MATPRHIARVCLWQERAAQDAAACSGRTRELDLVGYFAATVLSRVPNSGTALPGTNAAMRTRSPYFR